MIVAAGEALVDLVPEPRCGGGPMNVAVTAARLGAPAAFVGRVSTDAYGDLLWEHMARAGVHLESAERGPEATARAIVEHAPGPVFRFEGDHTADTQLASVDLSPLGEGPHVLHGGTLGLFRGRTAGVLAELAESVAGRGWVVSLDPNVRPQIITDRCAWLGWFEQWLAVAAVVKISSEDLAWIWPGEDEDAVAERLLAGGVRAVVTTHGAEGVVCYLPTGHLRVPAPEVEVVDTVGAGDAFCGALLSQLWTEAITSRAALEAVDAETWLTALTFAVTVAAITCTRSGADPPWAHELAVA